MKRYLILTALILAFLPTVAFGVTSNPNQNRTQNANEELNLKIQEMKESRAALKDSLKAEILVKVKERATKAVDRAIAKYEKTKIRIQNMPNISAENKATIGAKIDEAITKLRAEKAKIATATTADEVRTIMAEVKTQMREGYNAVKASVQAIHANRLTEATTRLTAVLDKLKVKVTELKVAGKTVTEMEALEVKAKTNIDAAKAAILANDFDGAKEKILAARKNLIDLSQTIKAERGEE